MDEACARPHTKLSCWKARASAVVGTGDLIEEGDNQVYLADDERVILYSEAYKGGTFWVLDDPEEELREQLSEGAYTEVMHALGISVTIDI